MDNSSGRFYVATLLGDPDNPNDDRKRMLFEKMPPTTYPSLMVDEEGFAVGTDDGYFENRPGISKNKLVWTWRPKKFDKIKMLQVIEIVTNPFTLRDDMVRVSYVIVNEDKREHKISVRLLLDTILGEGDEAPFFVPFFGKIDRETVFYEGNMPYIWYSFDSIKNPKVRTMGIVSGIEGVSTPAMLVFANWRKLDRDKWFYVPEVGASFGGGLFGGRDSAVAVYFKEAKLKPQELTLYSTMYGIYGDTLRKFDNFSVSLTTPEVVKSFPFTASVTIENTLGVDIRDLLVRIDINTNHFYITNLNYVSLSNLKIGDSVAFSWSIFPQTGLAEGEYEVKAKISGVAVSTNFEGEVFRKFRVSFETKEQRVELKELGVKQTEVVTNFGTTNVLTITNYYTNFFTNFFTNVTYITNLSEYVPVDEVSRLRGIIEKLNREIDYLLSTYHLTRTPEERALVKEKVNLIRAQIEVEKEKLRLLTKP
ncbi:MAG: hypothetical protein ABDH28_00450 [Brevinematia bacterium]